MPSNRFPKSVRKQKPNKTSNQKNQLNSLRLKISLSRFNKIPRTWQIIIVSAIVAIIVIPLTYCYRTWQEHKAKIDLAKITIRQCL